MQPVETRFGMRPPIVEKAVPALTDALRLTLEVHGCRIKIEVSPVARGAAWPPETRAVGANPATFTGPDSGVYDRTVQDRDSLKLERAA